MANQITSNLTSEEQAVFDVVSEIVTPLCTNLKTLVAWNYSVNLLKVVVVAEHINRKELMKQLPRGADLEGGSMTFACTSYEINIVIHRFLKEVYGTGGEGQVIAYEGGQK